MKIFEREKMIYDDGLEEGIKKGMEKGMGIMLLISAYREQHMSLDIIKIKLQEKFELSEMEAKKYIDSYLTASSSLVQRNRLNERLSPENIEIQR